MADDVVSQATHYEQNAAPARPRAVRSSLGAFLSFLFLLIIGIQGFHVIEHIVLVVQVEALGFGLAEAHGLLGSRVDFEWLHFSYNSAFLGALILMLVYGLRHRQELPAATGIPGMALAGAVGLQTYHVAEHVIRIVQYYQTGCTPCVGLIGRVVPFIWPHLFFGLIAYIPFVVCYFAYGMHRQLIEVVVSLIEGPASGSGRGDNDHDAASRGADGSLSPAPLSPLHAHRSSSIAKGRSHHGR